MKPVIKIIGATEVQTRLRVMSERSQDFRPVLGTIMTELIAWTDAQFDTEGQSGSGGWAPLADSTILGKAGAGLDPRIMHATLALRNALTRGGNPKGSKRQIRPQSLKYGTTIPYEGVHYTGRPGMPARPPVEITKGQKNKIKRQLTRWVKDGIA